MRDNNEDRFLVDEKLGLYVVCDGMGGHAAGEVAATIAIETARKTVRSATSLLRNVTNGESPYDELVELARAAVRDAARAVHDEAIRAPDHAGMGCTMTLLLLAGTAAAMAHVGDTRLYLDREGNVELLTTDHTMAADAVRRGMMSPEAAAGNRMANVLVRCIGSQSSVEVDSLFFRSQPSDRFLLCSDGLVERVETLAELSSFLSADDATGIAQDLVRTAVERDATDNVTAVIVCFETDDEEQKRLAELGKDEGQQLDALRGVSIFADLDFVDLLRIRSLCELRPFTKGELVVKEENNCDRLCVILEGQVELGSGKATLREMGPGDYIGDTTLLVRRNCRSVLRATANGRLLVLRGEDLRALARRRPWLGVNVLLRLAQRLSVELADAGDVLLEQVCQGSAKDAASLPRSIRSFLSLFRA